MASPGTSLQQPHTHTRTHAFWLQLKGLVGFQRHRTVPLLCSGVLALPCCPSTAFAVCGLTECGMQSKGKSQWLGLVGGQESSHCKQEGQSEPGS